MQLEESQGEAEAVPPEVNAADVEQYGVDPMCVRSQHVCHLPFARLRGRQIQQHGLCHFTGDSPKSLWRSELRGEDLIQSRVQVARSEHGMTVGVHSVQTPLAGCGRLAGARRAVRRVRTVERQGMSRLRTRA